MYCYDGQFKLSNSVAALQCESGRLETARAAHRAMVAWFAAGFHAAGLFFLEVIDEFRHDSFFHTESFQTRMRQRSIDAGKPGRVSGGHRTCTAGRHGRAGCWTKVDAGV